jgi:molecular chaperone HtpG
MEEKGTLSVHTENIFPIIKKFLYSDHEIFLRELVSNAVDATQKLQKLASLGEFQGELGELKIKVSIDENRKTLTVSDNGLGMTADEIKKYINQIAFSGANEFLEKYKDQTDTQNIIGKFGLGFYSSFMVADKVEIHTLSYQTGAEAAKWECEGSTTFEITKTVKKERGTDIVLFINEDSKEFLEKFRIRGILEKYCKFLPVEIEFDGQVINSIKPIWAKSPSDLEDKDYLEFYKALYPFSEDPLFWIHLNVDYPFNLTGILYFPKVKNDITQHKNKIQLYSRQVFITDEVKEVVPEFLMLLHGVIDSPDIPLNVSRSYLQSDGNVKKINTYITKKVADKLNELFKDNRESFQAKWESIGLFVKYGMISDDKFYDRAKTFALLTNLSGEFATIDEYLEKVAPLQTDKNGNRIFLYTTDQGKQHAYIQAAQKLGYDVLLMDGILDTHFIGTLERKIEKVSLKRVDADIASKLVEKDTQTVSVLTGKEKETVLEVFKEVVNDPKTTLEIEALAPEAMPVSIILPEFIRRMKEMSEMQGIMGGGFFPDSQKVVINGNHPLVSKIAQASQKEDQIKLARQAYDLALLSQGMLTGQALTSFIERSTAMMA